jgi:hypothetical protein
MSSKPLPQPIAGRVTVFWHALGRQGFVVESGIIAGVVAAVWLLLGLVGYALAGTECLVSAGVAAGVSFLAAEFALAIGRLFRGPAAAMYGMVAGMFARMSVALAFAVVLQRGLPLLADTAMIAYLLVFYLVTLAVETALLVAKIRPESSRPSTAMPKAV